MASFGVRPRDETAWPDFARLAERHRGVRGGCNRWVVARDVPASRPAARP